MKKLASAIAILSMIVSGLLANVGMASAHADLVGGIDNSPKSLCQAGWTYRTTGRGADVIVNIGPQLFSENKTGSPSTATFINNFSGTATATFTGGVNVSVSIKLAAIQASYSIAASLSMSASIGMQTTISIPNGMTGYGQYGISQAYTTGVEEYTTNACVVTQSSNVTSYAPYRAGWSTWTS
ncbi:MAG: hypothetical protein FWF43_08540 [Propionibacteriaceae bacterium]|nr:hypothetical protein [Propionibacteriaceae bacterium]